MNEQLIEGHDYYIDEQGLYVFTKEYHLKRGYCCENDCKHCPYNSGQSPVSSDQKKNNTGHRQLATGD